MNLFAPTSPWQRNRYWTTAACASTGILSAALLTQGHTLHGLLMLLAFGTLLRQSVLSRRARRRAAVANMRRAYHGASR